MFPDRPESLIWATRGRSWGFRFLLDGGLADPLQVYERSFAQLEDQQRTCRRIEAMVALRFPDPLGRRDASGRVIPHGFVVVGELADGIRSVEDGLRDVWPLVAETYSSIWNADGPPPVAELAR